VAGWHACGIARAGLGRLSKISLLQSRALSLGLLEDGERVLAAFGQQPELSPTGDKTGDILPGTVEPQVLELSANASAVVA
jgi:hypothetical protein